MSVNRVALQGWGITVLRVMVGAVFVAHGTQKLFSYGLSGVAGMFGQLGIPLPWLFAPIVSFVEFLGGLCLLMGLFTQYAAALLAVNMLVAVLAVHAKAGFFLPKGAEYALTLLAANISLVLSGPGCASLGACVGGRKCS